MPDSQNKNKNVVKVKAFPISAKLTAGGTAHPAQILKLTPSGFLCEVGVPGLKTGEKFDIEFEIPVLHHKVKEACVIVKIYTTAEAHVVEGHFQSPSEATEIKIMKFNASIPKAGGS